MNDFNDIDNCVLISNNGEETDELTQDIFAKLQRYINEVGRNPRENVWYDTTTNTCFGPEQIWHTSGGRESFLSFKDTFLWDSRWGLISYLDNYFHRVFDKGLYVTQELVCSHQADLFDKIQGSRILVVGGGPSAKHFSWNPNDYDYVVTCNHFFLHEKLHRADNVLLAFIGDEVDVSSDQYTSYFKNHDTIMCFENTTKTLETLESAKNMFPNHTMFAHTRYRSKIGAVPRLMAFVSAFNPSEVDVIGMDGGRDPKAGGYADHAFEIDKHSLGTYDYDLYRYQFIILWNYLLNDLGKGIKFRNLGEGYKTNMSTLITRQVL